MIANLFQQARESLTIPDAWHMLGLEGEPRTSCKSPFREDRNASFTIYDESRKWKDHGEQIGGDVIEFIRYAIKGTHADVRSWLQERIGTICAPRAVTKLPPKLKRISYPEPLTDGTEADFEALAKSRGWDVLTIRFMSLFGMIRFAKIRGHACYVITDEAGKCAEIRRIDGAPWLNVGKATKAFPLAGVDKSHLVGAVMLKQLPAEHILLVEGATDFISAWDLIIRYTKDKENRKRAWVPVALLGAGCKALSPECKDMLKGRHVRIAPDSDKAGSDMLEHWGKMLTSAGCTVDAVVMPEGKDLTDMKNEIQPQELFAL
jgi:hypothetical protein